MHRSMRDWLIFPLLKRINGLYEMISIYTNNKSPKQNNDTEYRKITWFAEKNIVV